MEICPAEAHTCWHISHPLWLVVSCDVGYLGEGEAELGVLGVGYYAESMFTDALSKRSHVDIADKVTEGQSLRNSASVLCVLRCEMY